VTLTNDDDLHLTRTTANDADLDAASARASSTFGYFWRELTWEGHRIAKGVDLAAVKVGFSDPDNDHVEYMWVSNIDFDGVVISGELLNAPDVLTSIAKGANVEIGLDEVYDWMYVREGNVYGGFTVDVIRARMSDTDRNAHDNAWGYTFPGPGNVALIPPSKAQQSATKPNPSIDHPMATHMATALAQSFENDASVDVDEITNSHGLNLLHQMALAGSAKTVKVLLDNGADAKALSPHGTTPAQLAQSLGWKHIVTLLQS